jgi:uncharacterized protein (TIGR02599 family)
VVRHSDYHCRHARHHLANNIIALIILPKGTDAAADTLAPAYAYDSRVGLNSGTGFSAYDSTKPTTTWTPGAAAPNGVQGQQINQMPPILRVAMVAIDEPSANILIGSGTTAPAAITTALTQTNPSTGVVLFTAGVNMDSDLLYLQNGTSGLTKISPHLNFRVFDTTIVVKSARFSTQ